MNRNVNPGIHGLRSFFCRRKYEIGDVLDDFNIIDGMALGPEPIADDVAVLSYQNLNGGSTSDDACLSHQLKSVAGR